MGTSPANTDTAKPFLGPWELFEVLEQEFAEIRGGDAFVAELGARRRQSGLTGVRIWDFVAADMLEPDQIFRRLVETEIVCNLPTGFLNLPADGKRAVLAPCLNAALQSTPDALVDACGRFLAKDRGRTLRVYKPDIGSLGTDEQPAVRARFNRQVLETAFTAMVRPVADRELNTVLESARQAEAAGDKKPNSARWALCLSGGGVRSASFSLGVIQELAKRDLLGRFDYLSTVSGGGYIGAWLSAWMQRVGRKQVEDALAAPHQGFPLDPELPPVKHLRSFSSYLAPRAGLLSADLWTLFATVLRNILLNWLVVLPALAGLLLAPVFASAFVANPPSHPFVWFVALVSIGLVGASTSVWFVHSRRPRMEKHDDGCDPSARAAPASERHKRWRDERSFLHLCLLPIAVSTAALTTALEWLLIGKIYPPRAVAALFGPDDTLLLLVFFGVVAHLLGWTAANRGLREWGRLTTYLEVLIIAFTGGLAGVFMFGTSLGIAVLSGLLGARVIGASIADATAAFPQAVLYTVLSFPGFIVGLILSGFVFVGLTSINRSDEEREWSSRYSAWLLIVAISWLLFAAVVIASDALHSVPRLLMSAGAAGATGWIAALVGRSGKTASGRTDSPTSTIGYAGLAGRFALPFAAVAALVLILMILAAIDVRVINALGTGNWEHTRRPILVLLIGVALVLIGVLASQLIDSNKFSLHAMYRARIIRAYLGASRASGTRDPNPFTGFDPDDNPEMHCLTDGAKGGKPPLHVVNIALNVTAGTKLEWQYRKARSFTVTPLFAGSTGVGYRRTSRDKGRLPLDAYYGGDNGISLGTAIAVSGAAANPNMGYHSSPVITFLMTLFNARLGWWLGNTGWAGKKTFHSANPSTLLAPIFHEMLSLTSDSEPLVNLSDGGHFENLGLYEMVLRRCRVIVAVDASCDEAFSFDDLGNAIRKIRIDFGIPIRFVDGAMKLRRYTPSASVEPGWKHFAIGRIGYSAVDAGADDGLLVYIKPALTGDEPRDVLSYRGSSPTFPHESTADQFFGELQLESYRALGVHSVEQLFADDEIRPEIRARISDRLLSNIKSGNRLFD